MTKACEHKWVVYSPVITDRTLMVECDICKKNGILPDPTIAEWNKVFSGEYAYKGKHSRIKVEE